jgi:cytochrome c-type biogenesis protein CcmH/NrfG
MAIQRSDRPSAIRYLQRAVAARAEDPFVYWFLGRLLALENRHTEAADAFENALRLWTGADEQRAKIREELEKSRQASAAGAAK